MATHVCALYMNRCGDEQWGVPIEVGFQPPAVTCVEDTIQDWWKHASSYVQALHRKCTLLVAHNTVPGAPIMS
jgi:hypothetical protein